MTARAPHSNVRIKRLAKPFENILHEQISLYQPNILVEQSLGDASKCSTAAQIKPTTKHYLLPTGSPRKQHAVDAE